MSQSGPFHTYMIRRETHSSRAQTSIVAAILILALVLWVGSEIILDILGGDHLLLAPETMFNIVVGLPASVADSLIYLAANLLAITGLIFCIKALSPGRFKKHWAANTTRSAYVIDDKVTAAAISQAVRRQFGLTSAQVSTSVYKRKVTVHITPNSGRPVDPQEITTFTQKTLDSYGLNPQLLASCAVSEKGIVA